MVTLETKKRESNENLRNLRAEGFIPAVFYGRKQSPVSISVKQKDFDKVWKEAGESTVITLSGDAGNHDVMIHDVDRDPLSGTVRHADFYVIEKGKKLQVSVPVEFEGVSPAVKESGAILVKVVHEVEVEALPENLPHELTVDISALVTLDSNITAGDIKLPKGVSLVTKPEEIVASVVMPKEETDTPTTVDLSAIEVEKKGKEAKEGESTEA